MDDTIDEHLVIAVDRVVLLDDHGAVDRTWHCAPGEPNLHTELTHAGIPTRPDLHPSTGPPSPASTIHLVVNLAADRAELLTEQNGCTAPPPGGAGAGLASLARRRLRIGQPSLLTRELIESQASTSSTTRYSWPPVAIVPLQHDGPQLFMNESRYASRKALKSL
ncbi:hypothetical protein M8C13_05215 [Crossiella sp. SN42]|uniref:hypothetical protein n=1 Tax=Crossiella sp. SN42 TaxID=2944808 RepID=UPI00207C11E4|nr:hypothetical protein [Crossiella sp. SN42]MCO1575158.1 hypothetical protein [Crossiella sp. SN42]